MCDKSICSDLNCYFKHKSYSKSNPNIKPNMCKVNMNIALQVWEQFDYSTCEIGTKQVPYTNAKLGNVRIMINQMIREERECGRL